MRRILPSLSLLAAILVAGCGGHESVVAPPVSDDDRALIGIALTFEANLVDAAVPALLDSAYLRTGRSTAEAVVPPVRRRITSVGRTVQIDLSVPDTTGRPTRALVTLRKHLLGTVEISIDGPVAPGFQAAGHSPEVAAFTRALDDYWSRTIVLRRITDPDSAERLASPWRIVSISGVTILSADHMLDCAACGTTAIVSARLQSAASSVDVTIPNLQQNWPVADVIRIEPGAQVTITMEVRKDRDMVALGYLAPQPVFSRSAQYIYVGDLHAPEEPGIYHVPLSVQDPNLDGTGTMDAVSWLVPIRVEHVAASPPLKQ